MISEDWSNDAENSALIMRINYILQYIHTSLNRTIKLFYYIFDKYIQPKQKMFFKKYYKNLIEPKLLKDSVFHKRNDHQPKYSMNLVFFPWYFTECINSENHYGHYEPPGSRCN